MTSQPGKQVLSYISRRKDNQTMKFGQLIQYNMRKIFLEKSSTKYVRKLFLDPFQKNYIEDIS